MLAMAKPPFTSAEAVDNPAANKLPDTITTDQLIEAVRKSGYPLQTHIADMLRGQFGLQEEWSYIDSETGELRSLDIVAHKALYDVADPNKSRVRPILTLLIECKQSDLPYVFFLNPEPLRTLEFPVFSGLFGANVVIKSDDDNSSWHEPIVHLLSMRDDPFVCAPAQCSVTFSKCARKGKEFELSGSEPFLKLVMPLVKAVKHFVQSQIPPPTAYYHDLHIAVPVGVLDAPMVGISFKDGQPQPTLVPWVRVFRHESAKSAEREERSKVYAIDLVHRNFLQTYIDQHAVPFAEKLAARSQKHDTVLAELEGFIPGMGKDSWTDLEARLKPRGFMSKVKDATQKIAIEVFSKGLDKLP
jgi:hypothetical protein